MGQLSSEDRALLEELRRKVGEAEKIVRDQTQTDSVKKMIQLIGGTARQRAARLDLEERLEQQKSPLLISLQTIGFESNFKEGAVIPPEELRAKLDIMCSSLNHALDSSSE